uniref:Mediator of RNA polymerase II transcription subunit 14 n=1 Tax=Picocystis salinarum TaxID=88271 RepID=A0A6U9PX99_9CHLO
MEGREVRRTVEGFARGVARGFANQAQVRVRNEKTTRWCGILRLLTRTCGCTTQDAIQKHGRGEEKRAKGELLQHLHQTQQRLARVAMLHRWNKTQGDERSGRNAAEEAARWESGCQEAADRLFAMHQQLLCVGTPNLDVKNAMHVLLRGECMLLPRGLHVPPLPAPLDPVREKEQDPVRQELEYHLTKAILREEMPEHVHLLDVHQGKAVLRILEQFEIHLTLCRSSSVDRVHQWKVIRVQHSGTLPFPADPSETLAMLGFEVEQRMNANLAPFRAICGLLGDLTAMLTLQTIKQYGNRLRQGKGSHHVHVALETHGKDNAMERVCFHLWTSQSDKPRILRLRAIATGNITGTLTLAPAGNEEAYSTHNMPSDVQTAREALRWAFDACSKDLLETLHARLHPHSVLHPGHGRGHASPRIESTVSRCGLECNDPGRSLALSLSKHRQVHVRVEHLTGKLLVAEKDGSSTHLTLQLHRLLQKERLLATPSGQLTAAVQKLVVEAQVVKLKQTFQLHGSSPWAGPAEDRPYPSQGPGYELEQSIFFRMPGWGSRQRPALLQVSVDPRGRPVTEKFTLHLSGDAKGGGRSDMDNHREEVVTIGADFQLGQRKKRKAIADEEGEGARLMDLARVGLHAAYVRLHTYDVESAIFSDEPHDSSNSSNQLRPDPAGTKRREGMLMCYGTSHYRMVFGGLRQSIFTVEMGWPSAPVARVSQIMLFSLFSQCLVWAEEKAGLWCFCLKYEGKSSGYVLSNVLQQLFGIFAWSAVVGRSSLDPEAIHLMRKGHASSMDLKEALCMGLRDDECTHPIPLPCCSLYPDDNLTLPCLESLFLRGHVTAAATAHATTMAALNLLKAQLVSGASQPLAHKVVILPKTCHRLQIFVHPLRALDILIINKDCMWIGVRSIRIAFDAKRQDEEGMCLDEILQEAGARHGLRFGQLTEHDVHQPGFLLEASQLSLVVYEVLSNAVAGHEKQEL